MPYSVSNSDSSLNFTVQDGAVDTSTLSVALVGTNAENYGDDIARNDIHLLENFASISAPMAGTVLTGQLWYDKTDSVLRVYKGTTGGWVNLETTISASAPTRLTARSGEAYFNSANTKGYIFDGANWKPTGYAGEVTSDYSSDSLVKNPTKFGSKIRAIFLKDTSGRAHPCLALVYVNNSTTNELYGTGTNGETLMALFNHDDQFTVDNVTSETEGDNINYYAELNATGGIGVILNKGMNLRSDYIAEAVALATEAVTAQKANALITTGNAVITADNLIHVGRSYIPTANITETLGDLTHLFDQTHTQNLYVGGSSAGEIRFGGNNIVSIGNASTQASVIYTQDLFVGDDLVVTDDMAVTGNTNLTGNTDITNNLQVNQNITGNATVTGVTVTDGTLQINSGSITQGVNGTFSGTVQFGTLSDGTIGITAWADEDTMSSNSATLVPTQQSVKAYVDTANTNMKTYVDLQDNSQDLDFAGDSGTGTVLIGGTTDSQSITFTGGDGITSTAGSQTLTLDVDNTVARTNVNETFDANVIITGNLTVNGTQTTVNSATLSVADNIITLNSDATGSASVNAGIEVERGDDTNVQLRWNETSDTWQFTNDGSTYTDIITYGSLSVTSASASGNGGLSYNNTTGVLSFTPADTSLSTKSTTNLSEGTNLYYTDARVLTKINATAASQLSDVSYSSPNVGQTLQWSGSAWAAATPASGVTTLVNLTDVDAGGSTTGQVLQKAANGNFTFGSVSSSNNYVDTLSFNTGTGLVTAGRNGLADLTVSLEGRYGAGTSNFSGSYNDLTSKPTVYAEPGIFSGGGTPSLASGVTAAEIRSLIGAGTSSVDGAGTPAITSNGSTPSLNSGISAAEIRSIIGAGTSSTNTTYTASGAVTLTGTNFTHTDTSSYGGTSGVARRYITGITVDTFGHITAVTTGTETDQSFPDNNYYVNAASFSSGTLTLSRTDGGTVTQSLDGRYLTSHQSLAGYATETYVTTRGYTSNTGTVTGVSGGTGVSSTGGTAPSLSIGQSVGTGDTVQFGLVRSTGDVVAYYSSDERLKDNISLIPNALDKVSKLRGVEFDWNDKQDVYQGHDVGVIAQDVQEVLPELVQERADGYLAVKYEKMVGLLIESIKELKTEVDNLKQQLNRD
ncbi:tail fiber domain-containing protein [bacterium]|nr:tail fiber domain-containing protein [bacterium]